MFMSLVGALAWLVLTMPAICVYVAYLQRHTKAPTLGHVRRGNRLLRWIRRNKARLGVWFRKLQGPLRLITLSDSAFKAQDYQGLVMRGCIILLIEAEVSQSGGTPSAGKSGGSPPAIKTGQEVKCQVLDWYARKHSRVVRSTYAAELLSLIDAVGQGNLIASCLDEVRVGAHTAIELLKRHQQGLRSIRHDAGIDAKAVYDGITATQPRTPADKPLFLHALAMREYLEAGWVDRLYWFDTLAMLADGLTKGAVDREALVLVCERGLWRVTGQAPEFKRLLDK